MPKQGGAIPPAPMQAAGGEIKDEQAGSGDERSEGEDDRVDEDAVEGSEKGAGEAPDLTTHWFGLTVVLDSSQNEGEKTGE